MYKSIKTFIYLFVHWFFDLSSKMHICLPATRTCIRAEIDAYIRQQRWRERYAGIHACMRIRMYVLKNAQTHVHTCGNAWPKISGCRCRLCMDISLIAPARYKGLRALNQTRTDGIYEKNERCEQSNEVELKYRLTNNKNQQTNAVMELCHCQDMTIKICVDLLPPGLEFDDQPIVCAGGSSWPFISAALETA